MLAGSDGAPMMQCPVHWPDGVKWVPISDLEYWRSWKTRTFERADGKETLSESGRAGEGWPAVGHAARREVDDGPQSRRAGDQADDGEPEKPTDELSEELTRTIKAAYQ